MRAMMTSVVLVSIFAFGVAATNVPAETDDSQVFEVSIALRPVALDRYHLLPRPTPDTLRCSALVRIGPDGASAWPVQDILIRPGESRDVRSTLGDLTLVFAARASNRSVEATVTISRETKVLARHRSNVWFGGARGYVPVE